MQECAKICVKKCKRAKNWKIDLWVIIVDSHYFMNHKKLLNVALRVGKGSMGMQGITELFHPWAKKSFYWMPCRRQKVLKKFEE